MNWTYDVDDNDPACWQIINEDLDNEKTVARGIESELDARKISYVHELIACVARAAMRGDQDSLILIKQVYDLPENIEDRVVSIAVSEDSFV